MLRKRVITLTLIIFFVFLEKGVIGFNDTENTIYVDDDGGADYTKIQDAIDAADEGDTIYVYSGTYYENLIVYKRISLVGQDKNSTIIEGGKNNHAIQIFANWTNISGLMIKTFYNRCVGILVTSDHNNIIGNIIKSNLEDIVLLGSFCTVSRNVIKDSVSGIELICSSYNKISENVFNNHDINTLSLNRYCRHNRIIKNEIDDSSIAGLILWLSSFNTIEKNNFFNCNINIFSSFGNRWYENYWSNWNRSSPYLIPAYLLIPKLLPFFERYDYHELKYYNYDMYPSGEPY